MTWKPLACLGTPLGPDYVTGRNVQAVPGDLLLLVDRAVDKYLPLTDYHGSEVPVRAEGICGDVSFHETAPLLCPVAGHRTPSAK